MFEVNGRVCDYSSEERKKHEKRKKKTSSYFSFPLPSLFSLSSRSFPHVLFLFPRVFLFPHVLFHFPRPVFQSVICPLINDVFNQNTQTKFVSAGITVAVDVHTEPSQTSPGLSCVRLDIGGGVLGIFLLKIDRIRFICFF